MQVNSEVIIHNRKQNSERWFEQRRDFFIRQVFDDFFSILRSFQGLYQMYLSCRKSENNSCFDMLNKQNETQRNQIWENLTAMVGTEVEKGPLWQLKDLCHRLWPEDESAHNLEGALIDWLIGSIFHEAMKLKENIHIINSYGPAAFKFSKPDPGDRAELLRLEVPVPRLAQMLGINGLMKRIVGDVVNQMEQLAFLFGLANYMMRTTITGLSDNMLVIRFLVEREETVLELWGEKVDAVFTDMFYGAPEQGFCAAGRSYLNGQWYAQALVMYQRAMEIDSSCDEAVVKAYQLQAIIRQNSEILGLHNFKCGAVDCECLSR